MTKEAKIAALEAAAAALAANRTPETWKAHEEAYIALHGPRKGAGRSSRAGLRQYNERAAQYGFKAKSFRR